MAKKTDPNTDENPGGNPGSDDGKTDWEKSYKGLQRKMAALQTQADTWKDERDGAITEVQSLKADLTTAQGEKEALETKVTGLETQVTEATGRADKAEGSLDRAELIMSDYPELAQFETDGLLPEAEDTEALKDKLEKFQKALDAKVDKGVDKTLEGATKTPNDDDDPDANLTEDQLYERMMDAANSGDTKERQRLQAQYDALTDN